MRAIVDKVMHVISLKQSVSDDEANRLHQEATELAAKLLENLKTQLAGTLRTRGGYER
jgi:hypothetical protein